MLGGTEKIAGMWFAWGDQYPGWHYVFAKSFIIMFVFNSSVLVLLGFAVSNQCKKMYVSCKAVNIFVWFSILISVVQQ